MDCDFTQISITTDYVLSVSSNTKPISCVTRIDISKAISTTFPLSLTRLNILAIQILPRSVPLLLLSYHDLNCAIKAWLNWALAFLWMQGHVKPTKRRLLIAPVAYLNGIINVNDTLIEPSSSTGCSYTWSQASWHCEAGDMVPHTSVNLPKSNQVNMKTTLKKSQSQPNTCQYPFQGQNFRDLNKPLVGSLDKFKSFCFSRLAMATGVCLVTVS